MMVWMQVVVEVSSNRRLADSPGDLLKVVEVEDVPQEASGLLEVEELREKANEAEVDVPTGRKWVLQSDENSFDFFRGLVKRKI